MLGKVCATHAGAGVDASIGLIAHMRATRLNSMFAQNQANFGISKPGVLMRTRFGNSVSCNSRFCFSRS